MIAQRIDLFVDHEIAIAIAVPKPIPLLTTSTFRNTELLLSNHMFLPAERRL